MKNYDIVSHVTVYDWDELSEIEKDLVSKAKEACQTSYAPYSNFHVGAALITDKGNIVTGCNQENPATPTSICAERSALFAAGAKFPDEAPVMLALAAYTNGEFTRNHIVPCGSCRQVMSGVSQRYGKPIRILMFGLSGIHVVDNVDAILPMPFEL